MDQHAVRRTERDSSQIKYMQAEEAFGWIKWVSNYAR
jgi:hypothetical protein